MQNEDKALVKFFFFVIIFIGISGDLILFEGRHILSPELKKSLYNEGKPAHFNNLQGFLHYMTWEERQNFIKREAGLIYADLITQAKQNEDLVEGSKAIRGFVEGMAGPNKAEAAKVDGDEPSGISSSLEGHKAALFDE